MSADNVAAVGIERGQEIKRAAQAVGRWSAPQVRRFERCTRADTFPDEWKERADYLTWRHGHPPCGLVHLAVVILLSDLPEADVSAVLNGGVS